MFNWFTKFFKAKVEQPTPVGHTINVPHIRCIAQQILNDLDIKNEEGWETKFVGDGYNGRMEMTLKGKLYTLCFSDSDYVYLKNVDGFSFNEDERKAIQKKIDDIGNFKYRREEQKRAKEQEEVLKKLFPTCYK